MMRRGITLLAVLVLLGSFLIPQNASGMTVDPKLFIEVKKFKFKPAKNGEPGELTLQKLTVTGVRYADGTILTEKTDFEPMIGAKIDFVDGKLIQSAGDPFTFMDANIEIKNRKTVYIAGLLTPITFDPGSDLTDGIVTLNDGFQLDNLIFSTLNTGAGSQFIDEYASLSSTTAGAFTLTLVSDNDVTKHIDLFDMKAQGEGSGMFKIPEPGTLVLLGSGLLGLASRRLRRQG